MELSKNIFDNNFQRFYQKMNIDLLLGRQNLTCAAYHRGPWYRGLPKVPIVALLESCGFDTAITVAVN